MATFTYKLVTKENKLSGGVISAFSKARAKETLSKNGSTIIFIAHDKTSSPFYKELSVSFGFKKIEKIFFFRNLATMISAGLSLATALEILVEQMKNKGVKKAIMAMSGEVKNGKKLSESMKKHPKYFSDYLVESIAVGEITGKLSDTMDRISTDLERDYELSKKVQGALAYPVIVIVVMVAVIIAVSTMILPQIAKLFEELNAPLPLITKVLLNTTVFMKSHPYFISLSLFGIITLFYFIYKSRRGRYAVHRAFLKLPIFGELIKEFNLARFFRALESLMMSGVSLVRSVDIAKKTLKNDVFKKTLETIHPVLLHGSPLSEVLKPFPHLFPMQTRRIVEVGEKTGKLEEVFLRINAHYERAVQHKTHVMASLIEPFLIVAIAVVVGGLAVSVFMPIYQVAVSF